MWLLKLQWSETEDKKKIPNAYIYEVLSLNILIMKATEEKVQNTFYGIQKDKLHEGGRVVKNKLRLICITR